MVRLTEMNLHYLHIPIRKLESTQRKLIIWHFDRLCWNFKSASGSGSASEFTCDRQWCWLAENSHDVWNERTVYLVQECFYKWMNCVWVRLIHVDVDVCICHHAMTVYNEHNLVSKYENCMVFFVLFFLKRVLI